MGDVIKVDFIRAFQQPEDEMTIRLDTMERRFTIEFNRPITRFVLTEKQASKVLTALAGMMFKLKESKE